MHKNIYRLLLLLVFTGLAAIPLQAQIPHLVFHVELSGSEAIPSTNSPGKALVTLLFTPDRKKADVSGMIINMQGTITSAKIHLGITGQTGPVIFDILPYINDRHFLGQMDVPPGLLENLLINSVYLDIRTTAYPAGEIRGQFFCETDLDYGSYLTGLDAVPANSSNGIAFGGIHFPLGSHDFVYAFVFRGLSGPITNAGIYEGTPGQTGGKVADIKGFFGTIIQGIVDLDTIDPNFLRKAIDGDYYVVINTANFPNGEIRGQLRHLGYFASLAPVNGVQQLPPPSPPTPGFGFSHTTLSGALDSLTTTIFINGIAPTSVKVRIGTPQEAGVELVDMGVSTVPGYYSKKYKITDAQLTDFAQGRLFINVTTAAYPNGELRGVMKNTLRKGYAFDLCNSQMVPPTNSNALGVAVASVDQANCYLHYKLIADGLSGTPTEAYYDTSAIGFNGINPFHYINNNLPIMTGSHEIMAWLGPVIESGHSYIQIHTPGYPNGEIRGQVRRKFTCPEVVSVNELDNIEYVAVSPVPFQDYLNIDLESAARIEGKLVMRDILGIVALSQPVQIERGEQTIHLYTGNLPKGMYTLMLESPDQQHVQLLKKVIKVD